MHGFTQWLEAKRIYNIRLNPEDAKYGVSRTGPSQINMDAWKAAVQSTRNAILNSYTPELKKADEKIRETLPEIRPDARCTRCGGKGYLDDREEWLPFQGKGQEVGKEGAKACFKCGGTGIEPTMEPVFFRRRVIDHLLKNIKEKKFNKIKEWAEKVRLDTSHAYRPILIDIVRLIFNNKFNEIYKLPH